MPRVSMGTDVAPAPIRTTAEVRVKEHERSAIRVYARCTGVAAALSLAVVGALAALVSADELETTVAAASNTLASPLVAPPRPAAPGVALAKPAPETARAAATCLVWADGAPPAPASPTPPAAVDPTRGRATSSPAPAPRRTRPVFERW